MATATAVATMTKRSKEARNDVAAKIDAEVVRIAKNVATYRGQSLAEYLSDSLRDVVVRDWREILSKEQQQLPRSKGEKK